jgi:hypothetical protein
MGYMHTYDVVVGVKLRLMVNLSDRPAGSIGIVTQTANNPWRFWLSWPMSGGNRYSLAYDAEDLRHFELIEEVMTEATCASVNYELAETAKPSRRRRNAIVEQLSLPLSDD